MDHHRVDRVGLLSPLEESSAEISRDSGIVSQSASSLSMVSEILSSGTVSQSPSFGAAANVIPRSPSLNEAAEPEIADQHYAEDDDDDEVLRHTALNYSSYIRATAGEEVCAEGCEHRRATKSCKAPQLYVLTSGVNVCSLFKK